MIRFECMSEELEEGTIGSVSIPQFIVLNGGLNTYTQWITLFEHSEDDEYDGEMGLNDDEEPMLLIKFEICEDKPEVEVEQAMMRSKVESSSKGMTTTTTTTVTSSTVTKQEAFSKQSSKVTTSEVTNSGATLSVTSAAAKKNTA